MNLDINNISAVLGVLGAYFAILLVLSVSVESILEPFSFFKGLQKKVSPDQIEEAKRYIVGVARQLEKKGGVSLEK